LTKYIDPASKSLWYLDHVRQLKKNGTTPAPVNVEIDLSNRCSHGCVWCHYAHTHTRGPLAQKGDKPGGRIAGGDLMSPILAAKILRQMKAAGVESVTWTGGGEPTLHPDFDDIIEVAARQNLKQGLYTHGGHITPERALLLKRNMTFVYISLDECRPETFNRSKGVNRFENVIANTKMLIASPGFATVGIGFLIHSGNWQDIPAMVDLGRELHPDYIQFRPTVLYEQHAQNRPAEETEWLNQAIPLLEEAGRESWVSADVERFKMYRDWNGHGYTRCRWSGLQTVITPNGKVWRCLNKREHEDALLGDLNEVDFADLWRLKGGVCQVNDSCRVMCRGHIANITLDAIMTRPAHPEFI
jgi:MoaA/NifB/PqqE/SkfB family radical SAM enzyme